MISLNEILDKKFDRAISGYKADDVDKYLREISTYISGIIREKTELENKINLVAEKLEEYRADEESLRAALLGAQKLGDSVIRESKNKAEIILRDAASKAERIAENAQRSYEKEQLTLVKMQKEVTNFKNKLLGLYKQHLELISSLPSFEEQKNTQTQPPSSQPPSYAAPSNVPQQNNANNIAPLGYEESVAKEQPRSTQRLNYEYENTHKNTPVLEYEEMGNEEHTKEMIIENSHEIKLENTSNFKENSMVRETKDTQKETMPKTNRSESKFGLMKFGEGFELERTDGHQRKKRETK